MQEINDSIMCNISNDPDLFKIVEFDTDQESLSLALLALTTHFAQVQFRLKQIINAPQFDRRLLLSLEEFACKGVPMLYSNDIKELTDKEFNGIQFGRNQILKQIETQLHELEKMQFSNFQFQNDAFLKKLETIEMNSNSYKQNIIMQLKNQITELEYFIEYIEKYENRNLELKHNNHLIRSTISEVKKKSLNSINKIYGVLQIFTLMQLSNLQNNYFHSFLSVNHSTNWIYLRSQLDKSIMDILNYVQNNDINYMNEILCDINLKMILEKRFVTSLTNLMQHGFTMRKKSNLMPLILCFNRSKSKDNNSILNPWLLILEYYKMKNGESFNSKPVRKLSLSFNLNLSNDNTNTNKDTLLATIGYILSFSITNNNKNFKSFIFSALNNQKLYSWLEIIYNSTNLINSCYESWSYALKTGFTDSLLTIKKLSSLKFKIYDDVLEHKVNNFVDIIE